MNRFLSRLHSDLRATRLSHRGATHPPNQVPKGLHKHYLRMRATILPAPLPLETRLAHALADRSSGSVGDVTAELSLAEAGTLFGLALGKHADSPRRMYPSGGALYPVETYLITTALEHAGAGVYHYNPTLHSLERLWNLPDDFTPKDVARHPESLDVTSLIVFTSVWHRSSAKYGDLSYLHALIEAGHMSQNLLLVGTALNLSMRPYAGFNDILVSQLLDLDDSTEQPIHSVTLCKKAKESIIS